MEAVAKSVTDLSDGIYNNPELALEEFKTSRSMREFLTGFGFSMETGLGGMDTAFRARFGSSPPVVALLAEMDALPGIGHGCGHNIGGAASIGAAAALSRTMGDSKELPGTIVVLGTPAEETGHGKTELIKAGVFDGIDVAMMVHGSSRRTVAKQFLGLMELNLTFSGRTSHASAYPDEGINALDAVIQTFNSINAMRQQLAPDMRVHGIITDGGRAPNIIPERSEARFFVRAGRMEDLDALKSRVLKCAEGAALATGCTLEATRVGEPNAPLKRNRAFADLYRGSLEFLGLVEDPHPADRNLGSSDIGDVSQVVPAIHPNIPIRKGIKVHTREFADATIGPDGHRALIEGVKTLGLTAIELIGNPANLERIKEEFMA